MLRVEKEMTKTVTDASTSDMLEYELSASNYLELTNPMRYKEVHKGLTTIRMYTPQEQWLLAEYRKWFWELLVNGKNLKPKNGTSSGND
jgi:hypothetical protein